MPCDNKALLKTIQAIFCIACLILKVCTTWEAYNVSLYLQKQSKEWDWRSYTEPIASPNLFMDITFGSYVIISLAFLIGHIIGDPRTKAETLLMVVGCILMFAIGGLLATWIDDIPKELIDNTIALAVLAVITGVLLLVDAGTKNLKIGRIRRTKAKPAPPTKKQKVQEEEAKKVEATKVESKPKVETQETQTFPNDVERKENGIKSVEIRIKDGLGRQTSSAVDVLSEAERVDHMLQASVKGVRHVPSIKASPLRHTTSYYINGVPGVPTPYAWHRLKEQN